MFKDNFFLNPFFSLGFFCWATALVCYPIGIFILKNLRIRSKGHVDHIIDEKTKCQKEKTPSFGGILFVFVPIIGLSLFVKNFLNDYFSFVFLIVSLAFVGLLDDVMKLVHLKKGISAKAKSLGQLLSATVFLALSFERCDLFFGVENWQLFQQFPIACSFIWLLFLVFVIVGTSNAVNLTDGMDGLAAILSLVTMSFLAVIAFYQKDNTTLAIILAFFCSLLAFFFFNFKPAKIFMGDVGSLPLGGLIAAISIYLKQPWILLLLGGVFVVETLSVMIQVFYFKKTKKRLFACAPLHHHYQFKGMKEGAIVLRFCMAQVFLGVLGLIFYSVFFVC